MDSNTEKIILVLYKREEHLQSYICTSTNYKEALSSMRNIRERESNIIDEVLAKNAFGRFEVSDHIVFVAPSDICNLHTSQYPLVIIKGEKIIDVDEWWYTPFKNILNEKYTTKYTFDLEQYREAEYASHALENGAYVKCTNKADSNDVLNAIKTTNIGFHIE